MGDPYVFTYNGQEFKLCCRGCAKDFDADRAKYVKQLEDAVKAAQKGKKSGGAAPTEQPAPMNHGGHLH